MKICLITSEFPPVIGGIASHVYELARALKARGYDLTIIFPVPLGSKFIPTDIPGVRILCPRIIKAKPIYDYYLRREILKLHHIQKFDLVHVHGIRPLAATSGLNIPVIFTNHSSGFLARMTANRLRRWRTSRLLRHINGLIAPSDQLVESAQSFGYSGPAKMIPNGVDIDRFYPGPNALRQTWHFRSDESVVLLARRLVVKNGVSYFAQAITKLKNKSARIVIAGDGADRQGMISILDRAGCLDRCLFLGRVLNSDMPDIFRAANVSVLPSLAEATSIAGLEAMASGLALVGTRVGGIPAIIEQGETGLLVPARDPQALADAIDQLLENAEMRRDMGKKARRRTEVEFSWPVIAGQTAEFYRACKS